MDWIKRNFGLKVTAVVIAIGLWFMFSYLAGSQSYNKTLLVPLALHGVDAGLVASSNIEEVSVELTGPRAALEQLVPADFVAYVDCAGKTAGTLALSVSVTGPGSDKVRSVSPPDVVVVLEQYGFRHVPVISDASGQAAIAVDVDPKSVVVAGSQTTVSRVIAVQVSVNGVDTSRPNTVVLRAAPVDAHLAVVNGVTVSPASVRVSIVPRNVGG
jgi:YbbR domain-containing protein